MDDEQKGGNLERVADDIADKISNKVVRFSKDKSRRQGQTRGADQQVDPEDRATRIPDNRHAVLEVNPGQLPELADEAERVLIEHDGNIYQRSGYLARLIKTKAETVHGVKRPAGNTVIVPVEQDYLIDRLNRLMGWQKWSDRKGKLVTCNAPRPVASTILARAGTWNFRHLVGVINAPTLRPDGSVLDQPGYDEQTGLLFVDGQPFPSIPKRPSRERGRRALDYLLDELLAGFSFAAPCDRSAALSALLTAAVRYSLRTAPLHVFSAPRPGSGKSLLADCVAMVVTGRPATVMSFTADPEEQRKRVLTVLLTGDQVLNLDNIEGALAGDALCLALTAETFTDRMLGTQKQGTAPTCVTWLATGNNLTVAGDMTRRVVMSNIDPQCERPEEREFSRNLYEWIPQNRPTLVAAALVALRSYLVAGCPPQPLRTFGSFEGWSNRVRSALVWLGEADPLLNRTHIEDADPAHRKLRSLLLAWFAEFRTAPATSKEAIYCANRLDRSENGDEVRRHPELYEVLSEYFSNRRGEIIAQRVGEFIKENLKRIECGIRFEDAGDYGTRKRWKVAIADQTALDAELPKFLNLAGKGAQGAQGAKTTDDSDNPLHLEHPVHPFSQRSENLADDDKVF